MLRFDSLSRLRNVKFHLVKFPEQVVREFQIRFIDLIDQKNRLLFLLKCLSHLSEADISGKAKHRPIVIITSNAEKELPDAFLRRCIFHYIAFPEQPMMEKIIKAHYPDLDQKLIDGVLDAFYRVRDLRGLQKKPSTSEVLDWIQALVIGGVPVEKLEKEIPFAGVLLKKTEDLKLVENNRYVY